MSKGFLDTIAFENEKCVIVTGCDASQLQLDAGRVGILVCIWLLDLRTLGSTSMAVPPMAKKRAVLTRRLSQCSKSNSSSSRSGLDHQSRIDLILLALVDQGLVDVWDHTAACDGRLNEGVELFVSTDGELKVARSDTLHFKILGGVSCQLEHFGGQVLQDGGAVHGSGGANTTVLVHTLLEETVDTADWELEPGLGRPGDGLLRGLLVFHRAILRRHVEYASGPH